MHLSAAYIFNHRCSRLLLMAGGLALLAQSQGAGRRWEPTAFSPIRPSALATGLAQSQEMSPLIQSACPALRFRRAPSWELEFEPLAIVARDFNGDGRPDALASDAYGGITVLLNDGAGGFTEAEEFYPGGYGKVATGDFNADGKLDLVTTYYDFNRVSIWPGDGRGGFTRPALDLTVEAPAAFVTGDFNADGKLDLAVASRTQQQVVVFPGNGNGTFGAARRLAVGRFPEELLAADFNGDGRLDLVTANDGLSTLSVLLSNNTGGGNNGFNAAATISLDTSGGQKLLSGTLSSADFNGDGKPDLAYVGLNGGGLRLLFNQGNGKFSVATETNLLPGTSGIVLSDFTGDGFADVVLLYAGAVALWRGNGAGGFELSAKYVKAGAVGAAGDFDQDGKPDLLIANGDRGLALLHNNGNGQFAAPRLHSIQVAEATSPLQPRRVLAGDVNNDGKADLVVITARTDGVLFPEAAGVVAVLLNTGSGEFATSSFQVQGRTDLERGLLADFTGDGKLDFAGTSQGAGLAVLRGDGTGAFAFPALYSFGNSFSILTAGDFNGDGKSDLALAHGAENRVYVLFSQGNSFAAVQTYEVGVNPSALATGDFNGDGKADLIAVNAGSSNFTLLLGQAANRLSARPAVRLAVGANWATAGDFNNDGKLDLVTANAGALAVLFGDGAGNFGAPQIHYSPTSISTLVSGDFNNDGKLDLVAQPNPAILLGDGQGHFSGTNIFRAAQSPVDVAAADLDGDGKQDLAVGATFGVAALLNATDCAAPNTPPSFMYPLPTLSLTPAQAFVISLGRVQDAETPPAQLAFNPISLPPGLTINRVTNEEGIIKIWGVTECNLALGAQTSTWRLVDGAGAANLVELSFNVTGAQAPTPFLYVSDETLTVPLDTSSTFGVDMSPSYLSGRVGLSASAGFRGKLHFSAGNDSRSNALLIRDAAPAGTHTITLTAYGACRAVATRSYTLRVTAPADCAAVNFGAPPLQVAGAVAVVINDFNRDGKPDLATPGSLAYGNAAGGFDQPVRFTTGDSWIAMVAADFNRDGWPDLAAATRNGFVEVLFNDQAGSFQQAAFYRVWSTVGDFGLTALTVGDFNGDGRPDLATIENPSNRQLALLLNQTDGAFALRYLSVGDNLLDIATADFNRDGKLELVLSGNGVTLLFGNGDGTFGEPVAATSATTAVRQAVGDLNGDGYPDLVVVNRLSNSVSVLLNRGDGTFGEPVSYFSGGLLAAAVAIGDLNRDGKADLVVANSEGGSVGVLFGNGAGAFNAPQAYWTNNAPSALVIADLNRDGQPDLIATGNPTALLFGDGAGGFDAPPAYSAGNRPDLIATADFNGDGLQDFVVGGRATTGFVFAYLAQAGGGFGPRIVIPAAPPNTAPVFILAADLDGDKRTDLAVANSGGEYIYLIRSLGNGNFSALGALPTNQGASYLAAADFNGDDRLDLAVVNTKARTVSLALNNGYGGFSITATLLPLPEPLAVAAADLNADGKPDLIVRGSLGTLALLPGDGAGGFGESALQTVGPALPLPANWIGILPYLLVTELNGDGKADLVIGDLFFGTYVLLGNGAGGFGAPRRLEGLGSFVTTGDFNGDGKLDLASGLALALGDGAGGFRVQKLYSGDSGAVAVLDVNRDGRPDLVVPNSRAGAIIFFNRSACGGVRAPTVATVVSAADYRGEALAAEEIVSLFGAQLATATLNAASRPLPTSLGGTTVRVRDSAGTERLALLFFVSPTQINYLMPAGAALGAATITVTAGENVVATARTQINHIAPGIFTAAANGRGLPAAQVLRIRADGSQQYEPVARYDAAQNRFVAEPISLGAAGEQVFLVLFGTGWRGRNALSAVTATIGGVSVPVRFAAAQGMLDGLDQLNLQLEPALAGRGLVEVIARVEGQALNTVQIQLR